MELYRHNQNAEFAGELFHPYIHMVYGICYKYLEDYDEASDALMQIFENMLQDLLQHEIKDFKNWLYMVSKNHCLKVIRRRKQHQRFIKSRNQTVSIMETEDQMALWIDGTEKYKEDELKKAISELKPKQKQCIEMFYMEGKSYKEIVEKTGFDLKEVKSYIQNGKRNLSIKLEHLKDL